MAHLSLKLVYITPSIHNNNKVSLNIKYKLKNKSHYYCSMCQKYKDICVVMGEVKEYNLDNIDKTRLNIRYIVLCEACATLEKI